MAGKNQKLSILSQIANQNTNLRNSPMRYMDHLSFLAGTPLEYAAKYHPDEDPLEYDAHGIVNRRRPKEVYLADQNFSKFETMKVLPHEGTHSKQVLARSKKSLPELSPDLIDSVKYLMEVNPKFLREYLGHSSDARQYKDIDAKSMEELLSQDEVGARLQAIEAMSPKGEMLEKSSYAKDLFATDNDINKYLSAMVPEGFIRNNSADSFRPTEDKRSLREKLRDLINN